MGSKWEEGKRARAERRSKDAFVQAQRRSHAALKQQQLLERLAEEGDENAKRELKRRADVNRPHVADDDAEERFG